MPETTKQRGIFNLLAVDDESGVLNSLRAVFEDSYNLFPARTAAEALDVIAKQDIQVAIVDLGLPDMPGLELLNRIKQSSPDTACIVLTASTGLAVGIEAMKAGAREYIVKPFDVDHITLVVRNAFENSCLAREVMHRRLNQQEMPRSLVGRSRQVKKVYEIIQQVARTDATVLITGESGTGKELVAQEIHRNSYRRDAPFIAVNCGAIPGELTESELFGHEKGAFTGAAQQKPGKFELAQHGTILLDEISTLSLNLQAKLLRVLQEKTLERVGGTRQIQLDLRVIAACNQPPKQLVSDGKFREDLYYRLNIMPVNLPPLRERKNDIPLLVKHFLDIYNRKYHKAVKELPDTIMACLGYYDWPGNVRELENIIQRLLVTAAGNAVRIEQLPIDIFGTGAGNKHLSLAEAQARMEKSYIQTILAITGKNQTTAAAMLGVHRNTLRRKMAELGLMEENRPTDQPPS